MIERSLILFKPDAVQRRITGKLLTRLEDKGLKLIGMKLLQITPELSKKHYAEHVSKPFYPNLEAFITAGPVIAVAVEGPSAVEVVRGMMGPTSGIKAPPGTVRGDFGQSRQCNLMHGSDSVEAAQRELAIYFKPEELVSWKVTLDEWVCAPDER